MVWYAKVVIVLLAVLLCSCKEKYQPVEFSGEIKKYGNQSSFVGKPGLSGPKAEIAIETDDGRIYTIDSDYKEELMSLERGVYRFKGYIREKSSGESVFVPLWYERKTE